MLNENIPMYLFHQGTNAKAYEYLGSHRDEEDENFTYFRVWAPHAVAVFVACDRNNWTGEGFELSRINEQGLWEGHFEGFKEFDAYKYLIIAQDGRKLMKCDPYAFHAETRPGTASKIYELGSFEWTDGTWMKKRRRKNIYASPMNIYELHVGSWQRYADGNTLSYRELADRLVPSCCRHGLHARGAAADNGAPVRRLVGISGHRILCADLTLRHAGRLHVFC